MNHFRILSIICGALCAVLLVNAPGDTFASASHSFQSPTVSSQSASDLVFAQTSEVTINLEKKMPSQMDIEKANEDSIQGEKPSALDGAVSESSSFSDIEDPFATQADEIPELKDPLEGYNRFMFNVNENIYDYFMEPVARGYRAVLHEDIRIALKNVFDNAMSPVKFVSSVVQGDLDKSARVLSRMVINTTVGLGGIFDVAGDGYAVDNVNEDFDQALGYHGVNTGPYIVLPFFGPSTARGMAGRVVDSFLNPTTFFSPSFLVGAGITMEEKVNDVSFIIEDKKSINESAIDEYESVRDFYHQYREGLLKE
ncbi:MAG: VacJ family lipoprotein [Candidatus Nitrohelix vancouverensis]|uniref:VacJ family lipoprotein n=1 Tax=Candidatus Nitrohelix vancouverensis TaxID=2705534 RepID=A0A7T0C3B9_9BACT|nr:MAG: VacJ family lipoprotein [Candidatus Nitrohelix vancouverensis]